MSDQAAHLIKLELMPRPAWVGMALGKSLSSVDWLWVGWVARHGMKIQVRPNADPSHEANQINSRAESIDQARTNNT